TIYGSSQSGKTMPPRPVGNHHLVNGRRQVAREMIKRGGTVVFIIGMGGEKQSGALRIHAASRKARW
ncbi:MAG: hypothetical protein ACK5ZJ_02505, partial [Acidobacteriota bacterium]